jgi:hypothetical protein
MACFSRIAALGLAVLLVACSSGYQRSTEPVLASPGVLGEPVGSVVLATGPASEPPLDLAVVVFDSGDPATGAAAPAFPTVRKAETLLLPVILAQTLRDSGAFGVVRVVHGDDVFLPLRLETTILTAEAAVLELEVRLYGADEELLHEERYRDEAQPTDYPVNAGSDPFADLYRAISNDVRATVQGLSPAYRQELARLALLRFGARLAPAGFARYVEDDGQGGLALAAYPADDDPMLARLQRLRRQDDLFVDTVDEQYRQLSLRVGDSYNLWRSYVYELESYGTAYRESAAQRDSRARRGSFASMQQVYATYRKVKLQEEDLQDLVRGFDGEALETVIDVDDDVFRLSGSVAERYEQWRAILSRIYDLETGGPAINP